MKANTVTLKILQAHALAIWDILSEIHPRLAKIDPPKISLNNRFWRTAGICFQETGQIELAAKFFPQYEKNMVNVILPHEIIHYADFVLFGDSDKKCGHGKNWQMLMLQYGLKPNPYHNMDISR